MSKILVTGGLGYIGSHTVVSLVQSGYEVVIVDNLSNSDIKVHRNLNKLLGKYLQVYIVDCLDLFGLDSIFEDNRDIVGVIHFAAFKSVGESVMDPIKYYNNNINSLINILKFMNLYQVKNLIFSSSCTVYGQPDLLPVTEESPIKPAESPYGRTKQMCEDIIRDTSKSMGINSIILRYFNPIGAHPSGLIGELPKGIPNNLLPYITQTAMGIREKLSIFGNNYKTPDGTCIRDFIDVTDLASAHVSSLDRLLTESNDMNVEEFNIGTGVGVSVLELLNEFMVSTGVNVNHEFTDRRDGDIEKIWADSSLANVKLNWVTKVPLSESLRNSWNWENSLRNENN